MRADVVIGSRATLKMLWPKGRAGSIPAPRTNKSSSHGGLFLVVTFAIIKVRAISLLKGKI